MDVEIGIRMTGNTSTKRSQINVGKMFGRGKHTLNNVTFFVRVRDFSKRWHLHQIPWVKNACEDSASLQFLGENQDLQQFSG